MAIRPLPRVLGQFTPAVRNMAGFRRMRLGRMRGLRLPAALMLLFVAHCNTSTWL